jgi:hypothetical protein
MSRKLTESIKKRIAGKQRYKCNNSPGSVLKGIENYDCPLWKFGQDGSFGEEGYEIDHIEEFSISENDDEKNLQTLCLNCHSIKTKRFMGKSLIERKHMRKQYEEENDGEDEESDKSNENNDEDESDEDYGEEGSDNENKNIVKYHKIKSGKFLIFQCNTCKKQFSKKDDYDKHLNRKTPCVFSGTVKKLQIFKCKCKKEFNRKDNYNKHLKICKVGQNIKNKKVIDTNNKTVNNIFVGGIYNFN